MTLGALLALTDTLGVSEPRLLEMLVACTATEPVAGFRFRTDATLLWAVAPIGYVGEATALRVTLNTLGPGAGADAWVQFSSDGAMAPLSSACIAQSTTAFACPVGDLTQTRDVEVMANFSSSGVRTINAYVSIDGAEVNIGNNTAFVTGSIRRRPIISWSPHSLTYGVPIGANQLNATVDVAGTLTYSVTPGTVLAAGEHIVVAMFAGADSYTDSATVERTLRVVPAQPVLQIVAASATYDGGAHAAVVTAAGVFGEALGPINVTYNGAVAAPINAGSYAVAASYAGSNNYASATASATLTITKAAPLIQWIASTPIVVGTPLGAAHLSPSANIGGTFTYTPAAGTTLPVGQHVLTARFRPIDTLNYVEATVTKTIEVTYGVCLDYDDDKSKKAGSTIPIRLRACDVAGQNLSSSSLIANVRQLIYVGTETSQTVEEPPPLQPDVNFVYESAQQAYRLNLRTKGLSPGSWELRFEFTGDPVRHAAPFSIK